MSKRTVGTSRERMMNALSNANTDYVPFDFMLWTSLEETCQDRVEFIERQLELGVDAHVELPNLPVRFHPDVKEEQREEETPDGVFIHKEYKTPAGDLGVVVRKTDDWPYGDFVPLFSDFLVGRSTEFLIERPDDLAALRYLLSPPTDEDIASFREQSAGLKRFAADRGLLVSAGQYGSQVGGGLPGRTVGAVGGDALLWLCGVQNAVLLAMDEPHALAELLDIISEWNMTRMKVALAEGIDLFVRRAWYESTDLWSPSLYRKFFFPTVKKEINLVHQAGAKYGYIMTSGVMPLLDDLLELGVDVLIGVDPVQGVGTDLETLKKKADGKMCLWGGVNGPLTVEKGTKEEIEEAVERSMSILGPRGFILSPVDNLTGAVESVLGNVKIMIGAWKSCLGGTA